MNLFKNHHCGPFYIPQTALPNLSLSSPRFLSPPPHGPLFPSTLSPFPPILISSCTPRLPNFKRTRVSKVSKVSAQALRSGDKWSYDGSVELEEDLAIDGAVYQKTLRLVECSMFAAVGGLAYFLSTSLSIENYFGCFFALPIVISSLRWGVAAGRKTMVATAMLLLVLSGPVKALTYLLMHGLVGVTMATLWRLQANWSLSIILCAFVRALGAVGCVLISSFLIRENIFALITVNIHASLSFVLSTVGINAMPSMNMIYLIFGTLVVLNCSFFVFLLHILYALFFIRLGMKASLNLPGWLEKAM